MSTDLVAFIVGQNGNELPIEVCMVPEELYAGDAPNPIWLVRVGGKDSGLGEFSNEADAIDAIDAAWGDNWQLRFINE